MTLHNIWAPAAPADKECCSDDEGAAGSAEEGTPDDDETSDEGGSDDEGAAGSADEGKEDECSKRAGERSDADRSDRVLARSSVVAITTG